MIKDFEIVGCRVSLKLDMLHANLDKFKDNMRAYSEEQAGRFYQDVIDFNAATRENGVSVMGKLIREGKG